MKTLQELIMDLPPELQTEVRDFVEFLLAKRARGTSPNPSLSWWGGAQALREQFSSVDLQHQANEWRIQSALGGNDVSRRQ